MRFPPSTLLVYKKHCLWNHFVQDFVSVGCRSLDFFLPLLSLLASLFAGYLKKNLLEYFYAVCWTERPLVSDLLLCGGLDLGFLPVDRHF